MSKYWFSRVTLSGDATNADWYRQAFGKGELYRDHAAIWRLFPGDDASRDFVYRVGGSRTDRSRVYYVVSARAPLPVPGQLAVEAKVYAPRFVEGDSLAFSLRANPTVSRGASGQRSKRHDVLMDAKHRAKPGEVLEAIEEAARKWFTDRAPTIGLALHADHLRQDRYLQHTVYRNGGHPLRFSSLDFNGIAAVTDPERLRQALFTGVGHSKGFGCGLLLVRPYR